MNGVSEWALAAGLAVASYLIGAVPFGLLVARLKGVDITKVGSGNIGATNVFRSVSKPLGILTFVCDAVKGWLPAYVFPLWVAAAGNAAADPSLGVLYAALAIAGHTWPVYLKFKGGKGVATSAGALIGIAPKAVGLGVLVWLAVFGVSRYVSVASIAAAVAVPAAAWWWHEPGRSLVLPVALTLLGVMIVWRHGGNIRRLRAGTEHRFGRKSR
jgi:acyl phosphate:glycerol-3-phosphate acyltransferase